MVQATLNLGPNATIRHGRQRKGLQLRDHKQAHGCARYLSSTRRARCWRSTHMGLMPCSRIPFAAIAAVRVCNWIGSRARQRRSGPGPLVRPRCDSYLLRPQRGLLRRRPLRLPAREARAPAHATLIAQVVVILCAGAHRGVHQQCASACE